MIEAAVIIGLAGWRIASLLVLEDGPFSVFDKLRQFLGLQPGPVTGFLPTMLSCIWCTSIWTTLAASIAYLIFAPAVIVTAAAAVAVLVNSFVNKE